MKTFGYWVYTITTPDGMVYVGVSMRETTNKRWKKGNYESCSLYPYIEKWGWKNLEKKVIKQGLSKERAFELEDELISFCDLNGVAINKRRSGLVTLDENGNTDMKAYHKANGYKNQYKWIRTHREEWNKMCLRNYYKRKWNKQLKELGYIPLF